MRRSLRGLRWRIPQVRAQLMRRDAGRACHIADTLRRDAALRPSRSRRLVNVNRAGQIGQLHVSFFKEELQSRFVHGRIVAQLTTKVKPLSCASR